MQLILNPASEPPENDRDILLVIEDGELVTSNGLLTIQGFYKSEFFTSYADYVDSASILGWCEMPKIELK